MHYRPLIRSHKKGPDNIVIKDGMPAGPNHSEEIYLRKLGLGRNA